MSKDASAILGDPQYNRAKLWQIVLFTLNNSSTNIYLFAFGFVTYYSTGLVGLTALFVSQIMGYIRIFDGVIDPAIGVLIDKTDTKFGKYRPIMVLGNLITVISFLILFNIHTMGDLVLAKRNQQQWLYSSQQLFTLFCSYCIQATSWYSCRWLS